MFLFHELYVYSNGENSYMLSNDKQNIFLINVCFLKPQPECNYNCDKNYTTALLVLSVMTHEYYQC